MIALNVCRLPSLRSCLSQARAGEASNLNWIFAEHPRLSSSAIKQWDASEICSSSFSLSQFCAKEHLWN
jgi:hypothetical protein